MNDNAFDDLPDERFDILLEVAEERVRQDKQWGGSGHDDQHNYDEWLDIIGRLGIYGIDSGKHRSALVKIAAVAVAAIEAIDRKGL